ncbi:MAK10-like protein [Tanacetum coccineum]|uniref:MAK10-like protein n=1 Tax=Tanacetum coccineum TaxID=301880 RepID=A0ABQ4XYH8_9ASTR
MVTKPKKVGSKERLASPKPRKPRTCLRWSPTTKMFDLKGKIIKSSESERQSSCFKGTVCFGNDHVAAILCYDDLQWGNLLITRVYFVEGLRHNLFLVGQLYDSVLEAAFRRNTCFIKNLEGVDPIAKSWITSNNINRNTTLSEVQGVSFRITSDVRELYTTFSALAGKLRWRGRSWVFDLNKSDLCPSFIKGLNAKGFGTSRGRFPYCMDSFQGLATKSPSLWHRPLAPNLALYDKEIWNDPRDFAKPVKAIALPQDVPSTSDHHLREIENQVQCLMEAHLAPTQPTQVNKVTTSCEICSGPHDTQYCMEYPEQAFVKYASSHTGEAGDLEALVSNFMASQDARLAKFEPDFKQQQSEMTNKINTVLKAITNQIAGGLSSDTDFHLNLPVLEVLDHAPIYNAILDKYVESLELGKNGSTFVQGEIPAKMEDPDYSLYLTDHIFILADGTKSYHVGIVKDVEVRIGKLKLLNDFYVIDMKKDPETPLLVGRGFLAIANAVIDCRMDKIRVGEGITRKDFLDCHLPREWEISRDAELNPFKDTLVFRRMVEFLGAIPINLKSNIWESDDLIQNPINWDKPPKNRDGAWHAKIRLIDPDGDEFTKTLQSVPTTRKLSKRESPREIIDLDHFYDT